MALAMIVGGEMKNLQKQAEGVGNGANLIGMNNPHEFIKKVASDDITPAVLSARQELVQRMREAGQEVEDIQPPQPPQAQMPPQQVAATGQKQMAPTPPPLPNTTTVNVDLKEDVEKVVSAIAEVKGSNDQVLKELAKVVFLLQDLAVNLKCILDSTFSPAEVENTETDGPNYEEVPQEPAVPPMTDGPHSDIVVEHNPEES